MKEQCSNCEGVASKNLLTQSCTTVPLCINCYDTFKLNMYKVAEGLSNIGYKNMHTLFIDLRDEANKITQSSAIQEANGTLTTMLDKKPEGTFNYGRPDSCIWCSDPFISAEELATHKDIITKTDTNGCGYLGTMCKKCGKTSAYRQYEAPFSYINIGGR